MQLLSRFEAYCPCCGYSLQGIAVVLISVRETERHGEVTIAAICSLCYASQLGAALDAAAYLHAPAMSGQSEITHGVRFFCPRNAGLVGHNAKDVFNAIEHGQALPILPHYDPPDYTPPPPEPTLWTPPRRSADPACDRPRTPQLPHG